MSADGWHTVPVQVRYQETDAMGVVYHANYLTWFEIGRTGWTKSKGFAYHDLEARGLYLPVVEAIVRYKAPARYGDDVAVRCRPREIGPVRLIFEYEIVLAGETSKMLVTGTTEHAWVDRDWKPVSLRKAAPDVYRAFVAAASGGGR